MGDLASNIVRSQAEPLDGILNRAGFRILARVLDSDRAVDFAIGLSAKLGVVRWTTNPLGSDHIALATMVVEGDFSWAGLVHSERSAPPGPIETFHVSELDRLVERLRQLGGLPDEAF